MTPSVHIVLCTVDWRAKHIGAVLGSLISVPNSIVQVIAHESCADLVPNFSSTRLYVDSNTLRPMPWRKWLGQPNDAKITIVVDDDKVYSLDDMLEAIDTCWNAKEPAVFQARNIGLRFKNPSTTSFKMLSVNERTQSDQVFAGCGLVMPTRVYSEVKNRIIDEVQTYSHEEALADDYVASRALAEMRFPIFSLPFKGNADDGEMHTFAMPFSRDARSLHTLEGGNFNRYRVLAERDLAKGRNWWAPLCKARGFSEAK